MTASRWLLGPRSRTQSLPVGRCRASWSKVRHSPPACMTARALRKLVSFTVPAVGCSALHFLQPTRLTARKMTPGGKAASCAGQAFHLRWCDLTTTALTASYSLTRSVHPANCRTGSNLPAGDGADSQRRQPSAFAWHGICIMPDLDSKSPMPRQHSCRRPWHANQLQRRL